MKKFNKFIIPFTAIATAVAIAPSSEVVAADSQLPTNSVIIGSQAFDLDYVNDPENEAEIKALIVAGGEIFVKVPNGTWLSNTAVPLTQEEVSNLPAVTYKAPNGTLTEISTGDGTGEPPAVELAVKSVMAITQTIKSNTEQELKFSVNGKEDLTATAFNEKYGEKYTVTFLYNFANPSDDAKNLGKVTNRSANFKYAVQVTDKDGNKIPETVTSSQFVDVKVLSATDVVEVTKLALFASDKKLGLDYITSSDKNISISIVEAKNAFGETLTIETPGVTSLGKIESVTSSNPLVASYDGTKIVSRTTGDVEFTVKFEDADLATVKLPVQIKEAQKVTKITQDNLRVVAEQDKKITIDVLDQFEQKLRTKVPDTVEVFVNDTKVTPTINIVAGEIGFTFNQEKGNYTVEVKQGTTSLGKFNVEAVDVSGVAEQFEIVKSVVNAEFEITRDEDGEVVATPVTLSVKGYIDGIEVPAGLSKIADTEDTSLELQFDEKVIIANRLGDDITVTPVAQGDTTLKLVKKQGDLEVVLAEYDVNVVSKVVQIHSLAYKTGFTAVLFDGAKPTKKQIAQALTAGTTTEAEILKDYMVVVESIDYIPADKKVIFKLDSASGGKEFMFDAKKVTGPVLTNPSITGENGEVTIDNGNISITVDADQSYELNGFTLNVPSGASSVTVATDIANVKDVTFKVADLPTIAEVITVLVKELDRESTSVTGNGLGKLDGQTVTVTDSRGFSTTFTFDVTVTAQ